MCVQNLNIAALAVAEIIGGTRKKLGSPWIRPRSLFSKKISWAFIRIDPLNVLGNLKSVAFPVTEIIGDTQKIWAVPGYAHAPFSLNYLMGFCSDGPLNVLAKFEIRSFSRSWDNRGTRKNGQSLDTPTLTFL